MVGGCFGREMFKKTVRNICEWVMDGLKEIVGYLNGVLKMEVDFCFSEMKSDYAYVG